MGIFAMLEARPSWRCAAQCRSWIIQHPKNATCHGTNKKIKSNTSPMETAVLRLKPGSSGFLTGASVPAPAQDA